MMTIMMTMMMLMLMLTIMIIIHTVFEQAGIVNPAAAAAHE